MKGIDVAVQGHLTREPESIKGEKGSVRRLSFLIDEMAGATWVQVEVKDSTPGRRDPMTKGSEVYAIGKGRLTITSGEDGKPHPVLLVKAEAVKAIGISRPCAPPFDRSRPIVAIRPTSPRQRVPVEK